MTASSSFVPIRAAHRREGGRSMTPIARPNEPDRDKLRLTRHHQFSHHLYEYPPLFTIPCTGLTQQTTSNSPSQHQPCSNTTY
ncbi:hypothetical protein LZ31DRAFT_271406 [Colletotrichum somersetense]|nr:hypothetical protein LZ31DRAFT_271406 [Colletotrichum somersetense]